MSLSSIVGNKKAIDEMSSCIASRKPVLLHGESGVGKTSSVYAFAQDNGYRVIETNASDKRDRNSMTNLMRMTRMRSFEKIIFLVDEVDGVEDMSVLPKILEHTQHPIVLTANEVWKIPKAVKDHCIEIRFYRPRLEDVVGVVKSKMQEYGVNPMFKGLHGDVRNSIANAYYGGSPYIASTIYDEVTRVFCEGKISEPVMENLSIWLLDNASRFFFGRDLYDAIERICMFDRTGEPKVLNFPRCNRVVVVQPYYLKRLKKLRGVTG